MPDVDAAEPVAAAILDAYPAAGRGNGSGVSLCIDAAVALDFAMLEARLEGSLLRPIPVAQCSGTALTDPNPLIGTTVHWADDKGAAAEKIRILAIECATAVRCVVDLDLPFNGWRYTVERSGSGWTVSDKNTRWIR